MGIKILTIDDHALFRRCMVDYLNAIDDIEVVGEAASPEQGYDLVLGKNPDIILLDLDLGGRSGMNLAERILKKKPDAKVVILSAYKEEDQIARAMQIGARGYLVKDIAPDEMVAELRKIMAGEMVYPHHFLLNQARSNVTGKAGRAAIPGDITPREKEVLQWVSEGRTDKEIATQLSVSEHTVKNHMKSIRKKLDASNRILASLKAIDLGIIER